jgi:CubicO group peptidase (beta-lactamase class C family)
MRSVAVPDSIMPGNQKWALSMRVILEPTYGRLPVGAYGWIGAYGTHFWVDPENQVVAVYMKNSFHDGGSGAKTAANFEKDVYL